MITYSLRQLTYFVAAAEHGSVAAAARSLNVSQPSISTAIAKLEDQFGVQLFIRHHARGVSPTQAARRLLIDARSLLAQAHEMGESAHDLGQAVRGELSLGGFVTVTPRFMPRLLKSFAAAHPDAGVRLFEGHQDELLAGLDDGRFELVLIYDVNLPEHLECRTLAAIESYVLLPPDHPLTAHEDIALADLAGVPMVLLDVPPSVEYFTSILRQAGVEPNVAYRSPSFETVRGMVGNGFGYSILATRPAGDITYDGLPIAYRPIRDNIEPGPLVLARLAQSRPTRLAETFSDFCEDWFRDQTDGTAAGRPGLPRPITGFHKDEHGDWVADLDCGHGQHVRHNPPFQNRPWVATAAGRKKMLGKELNCVKCVP